ncbi:MAG TPA: hypothetical protein PK918_05935 [Methanotrichaceae archaeon]|nr:hypothetical protein [Methanotrichaceae archaeon]HQI91671.1 hypothetical protein [Methanotrichaceae archaeon]
MREIWGGDDVLNLSRQGSLRGICYSPQCPDFVLVTHPKGPGFMHTVQAMKESSYQEM